MNKAVLKKTGKTVLILILAVIIAVNLLTIAFSCAGLRRQLKWMPCALLSVSTGSMEPAIHQGSLILVYETPYDELKTGDIITYCDNQDGFTTHRLLSKTESSFITKGDANTMSDGSIGREAYCAKMIVALPFLGALLNILTGPVQAIIAVLLVLFIFYVLPLIVRLFESKEKREKAAAKASSTLKNVVALTLASTFAVTPFMTAARYRQDINANTIISADAIYFTSDYMSQIGDDFSGNSYEVKGWSGADKTLNVSVKNAENTLLVNTTSDVPFAMYIEQIPDDNPYDNLTILDPSKYTVTINEDKAENYKTTGDATTFHRDVEGNTWTAGTIYGPYNLPKSTLDDGTYKTQSDTFEIQIKLNASIGTEGYPYGLAVKFKIMACTDQNTRFYQELKGEFTYYTSTDKQFLQWEKKDVSYCTNIDLITDFAEGVPEKNIFIYWDPSRSYFNENTPTAISLINGIGTNGFEYDRIIKGQDGQADYGRIKIPMSAKSHIVLTFTKFAACQGNTQVQYIYIAENESERPTSWPSQQGAKS